MNIPIELFEKWLVNKNLKAKTIKEYLYYFIKFTYQVFNQETISEFLSEKANRNIVSRAFLSNLKEFLRSNHRQINLSSELLAGVNEVQIPKITGRTKTRLVNPIAHEDIKKIEDKLETEQLKIQLLISYHCGLRMGEMLKIKATSFNWSDWNKDKTRYGECRVYGKGDKEGIALVPPELMARIIDYILNVHAKNMKTKDSKIFMYLEQTPGGASRQWQLKLREAGIKAGLTRFDENNVPIHETVVHPHRLRHAVQEDAEVLTLNGWKKYNEIVIGELIPTLNLEKDKIEFHPIKKLHTYKINEKIFHIKNRHLNYFCTPEHRGVFRVAKERQINNKRYTEWEDWKIISIENLLKEKNKRLIKHRISGIAEGYNSIGKSKAGILGWILTDGNIPKKDKAITISQSFSANKSKCEYIEKLLLDANITYSKSYCNRINKSNNMPSNIITFRLNKCDDKKNYKDNKNNAWIFEFINKDRTPKYNLLTLKREELEELFKCIMLGDGTNRKDGYKCNELTSQNKKRIDFFRALCSILGKRTILGYKKNNTDGYSKDKNKQYYRVYLTERNNCEIYPKSQIKEENYKGLVWCIETENGTFIARANETIFLTGNSLGNHLLNDNKMDIRSVQEVLRHSSITSTQIYTHINKEDLKNKLSSYSSSELSGIDGNSASSLSESKEGTADLM